MIKAIKETLKALVPNSPKKALLGLTALAGLYSFLASPAVAENKPEGVTCKDGICTFMEKKSQEKIEDKLNISGIEQLKKEKYGALFICSDSKSGEELFSKILNCYNIPRFKVSPKSKEFQEFLWDYKPQKWGYYSVALFKEGKYIGCFTDFEGLEKNIQVLYNKPNLKIADKIKREAGERLKKAKEQLKIRYKNLKEIMNDNFSYIQESDKAVVDFYAEWCGPCKEYAPKFENVLEKYPNVKCARVNIDKNKEIAEKYGIEAIPATVFFKNGKEIDRFTGYSEGREKTELESRIKKHYLPYNIFRNMTDRLKHK